MVWKKGQSGNPKGNVRNPFIEDLREAIIEVEEEKKLKLMKRYVRRAYEKDVVLMDIAKKLVPDLTHTETNLQIKDLEIAKQEIADDINGRIERGSGENTTASPG